jgi:class 3 adenylate cyclase
MGGTVSKVVDDLEQARDAAARHAWRDVHAAYSRAPGAELTPADLESFAEAAWWTGKLDQAIELRERAYAELVAAGETLHAARLAIALSDDHSGRGAFAVSQGWFANAERLLAGHPESAVHAELALASGVTNMFGGRLAESIAEYDRAQELARRFAARDTEMLAVAAKGRALVMSGEIGEGLALLDEASAIATTGTLGPYTMGLVYCLTISSCQDLADYRRAAEWTEVANRWCDRLEVSGFPGACRIHRAEIMRLRGDLRKAEQVALAACEEVYDFERAVTAGGYYEVGEIRRRLGDFAAADEAYRKAHELGKDPQPGVALLRLQEGKLDAAVAAITRTLEEVGEPLARLRRLPARVEIAVAANDLRTARTAADELERIVDDYKIDGRRTPGLDATVHIARGRVNLAEGDVAEAVSCLRTARDEWKAVGAPYETAQARTLLALAFRRQGDDHAATAELEASLATFEQLEAAIDAERVQELLGRRLARRTFVFTDIVGSTKLLETLGDDKWRRLLARHNELLRAAIVENGGEVVQQTGDGFFAAFDSPKPAVEAAIAIQRALDAEIVAPDVRIGVHTGEGFTNDGDFNRYGGEAVHLAARIGAASGAGEILVSRDSLDGIGGAFRVSEPRAETFKGFEAPVVVVAVAWR